MNKVVLIGRLCADPELRFAPGSGTAVSNFRLAVNRPKNKDGEVKVDFINCVAFGKRAETIAQYLTKGKQLAIEGNIRTGSYDHKDGYKVYTTDVYVETFDFVDSGNSNKNQNTEYKEDYSMTQEDFDDGDIPF